MVWNGLDCWHNPPARMRATASGLLIRTRPRTDFWQRTHYGFQRDDGHFLGKSVTGDFRAELRVQLRPRAKYDQAGLMVRVSESDWLKTSLEFEPEGASHLGVVATQDGYSDWSMMPAAPSAARDLGFLVERRGVEYSLYARIGGEPWMRTRLLRLQGDVGAAVTVGPYACSPTGPGCTVKFLDWRLDTLT